MTTCPHTGLTQPECSCSACLQALLEQHSQAAGITGISSDIAATSDITGISSDLAATSSDITGISSASPAGMPGGGADGVGTLNRPRARILRRIRQSRLRRAA